MADQPQQQRTFGTSGLIEVVLGPNRESFMVRGPSSVSIRARSQMARLGHKLIKFEKINRTQVDRISAGEDAGEDDRDLEQMVQEIEAQSLEVARLVFVPWDDEAQDAFIDIGLGDQQALFNAVFLEGATEPPSTPKKKSGRSSRSSKGSTAATKQSG